MTRISKERCVEGGSPDVLDVKMSMLALWLQVAMWKKNLEITVSHIFYQYRPYHKDVRFLLV